MITKEKIDTFMNHNWLAIAGVSRDPKKFGRLVYESMRKKTDRILPINPNIDPFENKNWFPDVSCLPEFIDHLLIVTPPEATAYVMQEAVEKNIRNVWIQKRSETPEAIQIAKENGIQLISGYCFLMFANPVGVHRVHRTIFDLMGKLPQ